MDKIQNQKRFLHRCQIYAEGTMGSLMGLDPRCEYCPYQIGKVGSPTHNDQTNNCRASDKDDSWFMAACPCAEAMLRKQRAFQRVACDATANPDGTWSCSACGTLVSRDATNCNKCLSRIREFQKNELRVTSHWPA
jgi:hypothetical protein